MKKIQCPFERPTLPECHRNNIENFPAFFPICPIRLSNLPCFNRPFPHKWEIRCRKPLPKRAKPMKTTSKISLVFLPSNYDTYMSSCILSYRENGILVNKSFTQGGRLVHHPKWITRAKAYRSHCCKACVR